MVKGDEDTGAAVDDHRPYDAGGIGEHERLRGDGFGAADDRRPREGAAVRSEDYLRVEHRYEGREVAAASGGEEGIDHFSLTTAIGVGSHRRSLHSAAAPARKLSRSGRRAPHDRRDLVERHR